MTDVEWGKEGHIAKAQLRKAVKLAREVRRHVKLGQTPDQLIENCTASDRRSIERLVEVPESSDTTWALVHELVVLDLV